MNPLPALLAALAPLLAASATPTVTPAAPTAAPPAVLPACQACHGAGGVSRNPVIPNLAGQKAGYLQAQLTAFREGRRKDDSMNAIAAQLSDDDIRALAQHWSTQPFAPDAGGESAIRSRMAFPSAFPAGFTLYQEESGDGIVVKRYANAPALEAARKGEALPSGSVLIAATHAAATDAAGKTVAGDLQNYSGMEARAGWGEAIPVLLRNGDWDYALFAPDGRRQDGVNQSVCLACHKPLDKSSYVFTLEKLTEAARAMKGGT